MRPGTSGNISSGGKCVNSFTLTPVRSGLQDKVFTKVIKCKTSVGQDYDTKYG